MSEDFDRLATSLPKDARHLMVAMRVTQRELAVRMGVTESRVSQMFMEDSNWTLKTTDMVFAALGCAVSYYVVHNGKYRGEA